MNPNAEITEKINNAVNEERDYIMFKLHKLFGGVHAHLENVCDKYLVDEQTTNKILTIVEELMDGTEEAVTGKKVEKPTTATEDEPDRLHVLEVITDGEKRITIPYDAFFDAGLTEQTVKICRERVKDTNTFYIVGDNFDVDLCDYEVVAKRYVEKNLRISVGKLLNAIPGNYVGIDVYEGQLVIYNTDGSIEDDPTTTEVVEDEVDKKDELTERGAAAFVKLLEALGFKTENIEEIANKQGPNFKLRAYKIKI